MWSHFSALLRASVTQTLTSSKDTKIPHNITATTSGVDPKNRVELNRLPNRRLRLDDIGTPVRVVQYVISQQFEQKHHDAGFVLLTSYSEQHNAKSPLIILPAEIRNKIWGEVLGDHTMSPQNRYVCRRDRCVFYRGNMTSYGDTYVAHTTPPTAITKLWLVRRQLYHEKISLVFSVNIVNQTA
jgi:hypothetical protein